MRIAHLSDLHIGPLPAMGWQTLLNKRATGYFNWHSKRAHIHDMAVLERVIVAIHAQAPDHIVVTGDMVNLGHEAEFVAARRWLEKLGPPEQVSLIPGNHDIYVRRSLAAMQAILGDYLASDAPQAPALPQAFPTVRRRQGVAIIGINSSVPTLPFLATGAVDQAQAQRLRELLRQTRAEGLFRLVLIHHPPHPGGARWGRWLSNRRDMMALLASEGADLVLYGHNHRARRDDLPCAHPEAHKPADTAQAGEAHLPQAKIHARPTAAVRAIPIIGAPSASAAPTHDPHHLAGFGLIEIAPAHRTFTHKVHWVR